MKFILAILSYLFFSFVSIATPLVNNYTKAAYGGGSTNWSMVQDTQGFLYVGNSQGLLTFDGIVWKLYPLPNKMPVHALAIEGNRVFVGSYEEFGYFWKDALGKMIYVSLSDSLRGFDFKNEDIWKIYVHGGHVFFQAFGTVFRFDGQQVTPIKPPAPLLFLFQVNQTLVGQVVGQGLYVLDGFSFKPLPDTEILAATFVLSIFTFRSGEWLIGTSTSGLYRYDGQTLQPWDCEASRFVKTFQLNNALPYGDNYFLIGTILNGFIMVNLQGKIVKQVNKTRGLQDNTVLCLLVDREQNLWAGLNHGIDYIELSSPYEFFVDKSGQIGSVHTACVYNGYLYLGTNQGLFYKKWQEDDRLMETAEDFTFIKGSQGHVLELAVCNGQLLCGHNQGTFSISRTNQLEKISDVTGGWHLCQVTQNGETFLVQGTYTGLVVYRIQNGRWVFSHRVAGFSEPVNYLLYDTQGNLWASHAFKGVYKLTLDRALKTVTEIKYFGRNEGFPSDFNIQVFLLRNQLIFTTRQQFYTYDPLIGKTKPYQSLNQILARYAQAKMALKANGDDFWLVTPQTFALVGFRNGQIEVLEEHLFRAFNNELVEGFENVVSLSDSVFLFCMHHGFALYNQKNSGTPKDLWKSQVYITTVTCQEGSLPLVVSGRPMVTIPYSGNFMRFSFANPIYARKDLKFQHRLENLHSEWQETLNQTEKEYTRLPPGKYRFVVRVVNHQGHISEEASYPFEVLPPWYLSGMGLFLYGLLGLGMLMLIRTFFKERYRKQQEEIRLKLEKEKEEQVKKEALAHERRLMELEKEKLEEEVKYKSRQLVNSTMGIIKKNEVLIEIKEAINDGKKGKLPEADALQKVLRIVNKNLTDEQEWHVFESNFDQAHEHFLKNLKKRYPSLTPKDLRFCAYLRMNMSSKEIASLLNLSVRGVEIRRYRLRRKLDLPHDKNLVEFMLDL
ncbi:triple tyrosine motif-containing protein [Rhodoflexus sp.]